MSNMYELTLAEVNTFTTGSFFPNANSCNVTTVTPVSMSNTGSWGGLANTQNSYTVSSSYVLTSESGSWGGLASTQGTSLIVTESYDRDNPTDSSHPFTNQSMGAGAWDPFPIPETPPEPDLPQRDTTRFRKAYSSQRAQPKRFRLIKR